MRSWNFQHDQLRTRNSTDSESSSWTKERSLALRSDVSLPTFQVNKQAVKVPRKVSDALEAKGFNVDQYGVVRWKKNSHGHPRKWSIVRKCYDSAIICFLEFFMTMVSNMGSSIAPHAMSQFGIDRSSALVCFTTVYLLGQAIGGLIFPPVAESFGGQFIYVSSTFGYSLSCLAIAIWPSLPVVVSLRFLSGMLSAMPAVVAAGSIENMWDSRARIWVIHAWIAGAVVGLCLGPPIATYVSLSAMSWPWLFYLAAAVTLAVAVFCLGMQESRPSQLLRQEIRSVACKTSFDGLSTDGSASMPDAKTFWTISFTMPLKLFFTESIVFFTSIMAATVYGVTYLFSEALSIVYIEGFGFTAREGSLIFLAMAAGVVFTFLPRLYDLYVIDLRQKHNELATPEDKLFGFFLAAPVLTTALWWFAWTVPPLVQGISPLPSIASLVLVGFSVVEFDNVLCGYLTDAYASYAASANAPMAFLRAIMSGTFPLFGSQMFSNLGNNNALFVLATIATAYCGIAALFGIYGKRIRERSPFAEKTWTTSHSDEHIVGVAVELPVPELCLVGKPHLIW